MEEINPLPNSPASSQAVVTPPVNSPSSNKSVLIILLIVFSVVLSSLITYLLIKSQVPSQAPVVSPTPIVQTSPTPTPDPTANWKTYTNTKYNYSLKYENNSNLKQLNCSTTPMQKGDDKFILEEVNSTFPECGAGGYSWPISIEQGQALSCSDSEGWKALLTEIKIDSKKSPRCTKTFIGERLMPDPDIIDQVIVTKNNGASFYISLTNPKYLSTFDQILSTFKFLE